MVKLKELKLKTVKLDTDEADDCLKCGTPFNLFDKILVRDDHQEYVVCDKCGEIYKVKE
jgi:uncharacterized protein with PIN domain